MQHYAVEWEGLKSRTFECTGRHSANAVVLGQSVLVFHQQGDRLYNLRSNGSAWNFVTHKGSFDFYAAGRYETIASGPSPAKGVKVEIPVAFENSVREEGHWRVELSPRFQFQDRRLEGLVQSLLHAVQRGMAPADAVLLSVAVVDRLHETAQHAVPGDRPPRFTDTVRRLITEYIDEYLGCSVDVDKVAFLTGLARTQFGKVFRESFGMPLHQYVLTRKIEVASRRLLEKVRVTELSHELGFSSHAHFSTVFRHHVGITPSQYRRNGALLEKDKV